MTSAIDPTKPTAHIAFTADVRNNFQIAHDEITALQNFAVGPANPTAMVGPVAIPGSAGTFMRSDAAPALANTAVTAGSYTYATLTVDAQGRLTAASSGATPITGNQTITLSGDVTGSGATSIATTVTGLQNRPVATTAPTTNQLLQWTGTAWSPATVATSANVFVGDTAPGSPVAGQFWWNSSPGDGQLYLYYNDGTSSQWVVANNPGSGIYLPLVGGQLNPGGLLVGTAGTVPGSGSLTLNANTVAPPAGLTPNLYVVGADGSAGTVAIDAFGASAPNITNRRSRGTAAAPAAVQSGDNLSAYNAAGYGATGYSATSAAIRFQASQNWTDTAQGSTILLSTTANNAAATNTVRATIGQGVQISSAAPFVDPGNGSLALNANTVAPPGGTGGGLLTAVGADGTNAAVTIDSFGSAAATYLLLRHARGTAAAPTAIQAFDYLGAISGVGHNGSAYVSGSALISLAANENWTTSARGSRIDFTTTIAGGTTTATSLTLAGNTATFSGNVQAAGPIICTGSTGTHQINTQTTGANWQLYASANIVRLSDFAVDRFQIDTSGNLTISGSTGTKASGTTWANPSARDIKNDIQPYDKGLQAVLALKPSTYRFQKGLGLPEGRHIGLVHDETAHMPEMHTTARIGSGDEEREVDALDCSAVTWALVNAIRELTQRLEKLEGAK